ncbi:MAG: saccharopine dehydrogenase NADP-binding domain-containing protein [Candidatus Woesearchaeota archaeon]
MRVLLIGTGAVGHVLSEFLIKDKTVSRLICASNDLKRAKSHINIKHKKLRLINLDASKKEEVIRAAKGVDVIINAGLPDFNETVMRAALEVKADYQDLCSHLKDLRTPEQMKYHRKFKSARITALINTGVAPGVTNLLARDIADDLDSVSAIRIRLLEEQKASEFIPSWSVNVTLDELSCPPIRYSGGKIRLSEPFGDIEEYEFPHPYGKRMVVNLYGDEIATLPRFIRTKSIDFKSGGSDIDLSRMLYKMGLFSNKPIKINDISVVPVDLFCKIAPQVPTPKEMRLLIKNKIVENSIFISVVEGEGIRSGKKILIKKIVTYPDLIAIQKVMPGATYISYPTGIAAYAFFKILQKIKEKGVFPPEALDAGLRKEVLLELESRGIVVDEQSSRIRIADKGR